MKVSECSAHTGILHALEHGHTGCRHWTHVLEGACPQHPLLPWPPSARMPRLSRVAAVPSPLAASRPSLPRPPVNTVHTVPAPALKPRPGSPQQRHEECPGRS